MHHYCRRDFLKTAISGAGLLMAAPAWASTAETPAKVSAFNGSDLVSLGRTGIQVSRLAQGTGYNGGARSSAHTLMGEKAFDALLRHGLDQGIRFLDMADLYGSHPFVSKVIKGLPRDQYALLSKIWTRKENWVTPSGGAAEEVDRFRKELNVDMIDVVLIHCMTDNRWIEDQARVRDELSKLKEKGVIRAVGVSCHDFGALQVAASHPWIDVIFARINYKGGSEYSMDGTADAVSAVLKQARAHGKAVVGMKIFGAGKLVKPEEKDMSLKYVFANQLVDAITIGMLSQSEVDDTLARMSRVKMA